MDGRRVWGATAVLVAGCALMPLTASAADNGPSRPDLVVTELTEPPPRAWPGDRFAVEAVTANEGRRRAAASETVVRLVRRAWRGSHAVPALRRGASSSGRLEVAIPASIDDGEYRLVACADARRDVRESDERNNCSSSSGALVIDTTPPAAPRLESHPPAVSAETRATFVFSSAEDVDFACRLDDAAPAPCESPHHVTGLGEGPHRFQVTARDGAGNESEPAEFMWTVDLTPPPAPSIVESPAPVTLGGDAGFVFSSTEENVGFVCALDGEPPAPCTSPAEYAGLADGEHAFEVRARDAAGNQSAPAEVTWLVIPDEMTLGDGAWSWFADPRAVHHQGLHRRTYVGWVARDGDVKVSAYDHDTLTKTTAQVAPRLEVDDHANPAIQILPDGRVRAYYSAHGGARMWYRTSLRPEDVSAWGPAAAMPANSTGTRGFTYPNPIHLASEGRTFLFWRGGNYKPTFATQADGSDTWTDVQTLISDPPPSTARPYVKYDTDGSTIHVAFTNAHPNESSDVNIYYAAYRDGALRRADGTPIGTLEQPLAPSEAELIRDTPDNLWIHDVAHDDQGRPILVYAAFAPNPDPDRDVRHRFIHRYFYSRWTGERWETWPITDAGGSIADDAREPYYSGGITLDHEDPRTVYLSREVGAVFEVETWTTPDGGETWSSEAVTAASDTRNVRPVSPRGMLPFSGDMSVLWMRGAYPYYLTYQTSITTILRTGGNAPPVADATTSARTGLALHDMGFDGRLSHDPDGTVVDYRWDFGDGKQGTGPQVTHAYQSAGRYFASLTVTDNSGARDTYVAEVRIDPAVATGPALDVTGDSATLHGAVTPHQATTYHFEYGTAALDARTGDQTLTGSGTAAVDVEATLSGLTPGAVYQYRLVATNANGTTAASVRTFTAGAPAGPGHYREVVLGTPGLAGYWRLGEAAGLVAADERAAHAGAYAQTGVTLGQAGALRGDPDTAAAFDGATGEMSAPTPDLSTAGTLEGWFHWQAGVAVMRDHTSAGGTGWILAYDSGGATPRIACRAGGTALISSKPVAQVRDGWHHFALTRNGEDVRLYLDGVRLEIPATSPGTGVSAPPWHIMRNGSTTQYTRGRADEVAVYDRALTAADIRQRAALAAGG